uniref:Uncharacterized protein n=1 Tax=Setaria viridis TaxID=4556 RepID=A0A4V6D4G0_SETVI|nr:hypothetical protein SEVIR_7G235750v2 [Setaria viridis]
MLRPRQSRLRPPRTPPRRSEQTASMTHRPGASARLDILISPALKREQGRRRDGGGGENG